MPAHAWGLHKEERMLAKELMLARDRRVVRALLYGALVVSGVGSFFVPISTFAADIALKACGVFLIVGGAISLVGHIKRLLGVELVGFPLLLTAMGALSLSAFVGGAATPPRYFLASLCTAFTFSLFARAHDLQALIRLGKAFNGGGRA